MDIKDLKSIEEFVIWRRRNKINQAEVAKFCGVSLSMISKLELGEITSIKHSLKYNEFIRQYEENKAKKIKELR